VRTLGVRTYWTQAGATLRPWAWMDVTAGPASHPLRATVFGPVGRRDPRRGRAQGIGRLIVWRKYTCFPDRQAPSRRDRSALGAGSTLERQTTGKRRYPERTGGIGRRCVRATSPEQVCRGQERPSQGFLRDDRRRVMPPHPRRIGAPGLACTLSSRARPASSATR
jgi:hypothetical protein